MRTGLTAELYEEVVRGRLDAALCLHPAFVLPKTLQWVPLREERLVVLAPERWAHRDPHELLRNEPLVRYNRELGGGQAAERYLRSAGIVPHERFEISSLAAIAMLVARGVGVSIAPDAATAWWPTLPVARLPLPNASGARCFGVLWSRTSPRTRAIEVLVDHARRVMGEHAGPATDDADPAMPTDEWRAIPDDRGGSPCRVAGTMRHIRDWSSPQCNRISSSRFRSPQRSCWAHVAAGRQDHRLRATEDKQPMGRVRAAALAARAQVANPACSPPTPR